jgi:hypothetical protein
MWNLKLIALIATSTLLAGSVVYAYSKGRQSGMQEVQISWDSEKAQALAAQAEEQMKARQTEQALKTLIDKQRKDHQREAIRLANDYAAVVVSLQDRPDRPGVGGVPTGASAGVEPARGCTGAELFREDAEVALGIARDADQLRLALKACIAHTTEIERELNKD